MSFSLGSANRTPELDPLPRGQPGDTAAGRREGGLCHLRRCVIRRGFHAVEAGVPRVSRKLRHRASLRRPALPMEPSKPIRLPADSACAGPGVEDTSISHRHGARSPLRRSTRADEQPFPDGNRSLPRGPGRQGGRHSPHDHRGDRPDGVRRGPGRNHRHRELADAQPLPAAARVERPPVRCPDHGADGAAGGQGHERGRAVLSVPRGPRAETGVRRSHGSFVPRARLPFDPAADGRFPAGSHGPHEDPEAHFQRFQNHPRRPGAGINLRLRAADPRLLPCPRNRRDPAGGGPGVRAVPRVRRFV